MIESIVINMKAKINQVRDSNDYTRSSNNPYYKVTDVNPISTGGGRIPPRW